MVCQMYWNHFIPLAGPHVDFKLSSAASKRAPASYIYTHMHIFSLSLNVIVTLKSEQVYQKDAFFPCYSVF